MTNILELLKNEKVEWKKLGEVCKEKFWMMPATPKFINDKGIPYITGKNIRQGEIDFTKVKYISEEDFYSISKNRKLEVDDILVSMIGTIGEVGIVNSSKKFYGQNLYVLRLDKDKVINRYFYYYFSQSKVKETLVSKKNSSSQGYIRAGQLECLEIPIPSLEIQERIVKILDKFTNYVTELQSELQSRTKQYTYYRDMLLSEEYLNKITKEMEEDRRLSTVKLEEVVTIKNGKDWKKLEKGDIPVYGSGGEMGVYVDKYSYDKPTVLIPRKGSIENVFYLDKPFWNVDTIFHTEIDESKLMPKYFYYFIEQYDLSKLSDNPTRPSLTQSTLNKLIMDLPPLSLQNKIVKVLDKFQLLLEDTKGLLPKEIEQRQKQYEYWREQLLSFSK